MAKVGSRIQKQLNDAERYAQWEAKQMKAERERQEFKARLELQFEVTNNPKKDALFKWAWELGHSEGFGCVESYYQDLLELIK